MSWRNALYLYLLAFVITLALIIGWRLSDQAMAVIIGVVAVVIVTLLCVGFFRLLVVYLPGHHVWAAYLGLGFLFCVGGAILYSRRGSPVPAGD